MNEYKATYKVNNKILGEKIYTYDIKTLEEKENFFYNKFIGDFKVATKLYYIDSLEDINVLKINELLKNLEININHIEIITSENYYKIHNKKDNSIKELKIS